MCFRAKFATIRTEKHWFLLFLVKIKFPAETRVEPAARNNKTNGANLPTSRMDDHRETATTGKTDVVMPQVSEQPKTQKMYVLLFVRPENPVITSSYFSSIRLNPLFPLINKISAFPESEYFVLVFSILI